MAIFGAQGIRDAMYKSYHKHVQVAREQPLPDGTTEHQMGLYGGLASRYVLSFKRPQEELIWLELTPFLNLAPETGLRALAEYIVFKEMSLNADVAWLTDRVQEGLDRMAAEEREIITATAEGKNWAWVALI